MVAEGTGGGEKSSLPLFVLGFYCLLLTLPPPPLQRSLLWMLPLEMWQEALDFCSFPDYTRMISASGKFHFLLEQSLLEQRFDTLFPSPALGDCGWRRVICRQLLHAFCTWVCWFLNARVLLVRVISFLLAGKMSMASPVAVEHLEEIVPLPFLRRLVCFLIFSESPWSR